MSNRFTSLSPACLRSQRRSFLIIAALCFNYLPLSAQAIIPLSTPGERNQQVERRLPLLSDHGHSVSPDLAQSQAGQNPPGQAGQQDQPIRVKTELIELRAVVTDKRGQAIKDLKKEDFELMENGKPREVSFFSVVKIPGRGEARQTVNTPANGTTDVPAGAARPAESIGRTVLLYVDTLHLSPQSLLSVKQSLRKFIGERLTDQDLTAIVTSAGSLGVVEQFTRDRRVLRYAVDRLSSRPSARDSLFTPYIAGLVDRRDSEGLQVARAIYIAEENPSPLDPSIMQMVQARARQVLSEATYLRRATLSTLKEVVQR